jgi:glycosyltransferase involved in cell wall biosynthesis
MKRKIVLLQSGLGAGGAEKIVNLIAKHRLNMGDEVHVVAISGDPAKSFFEYPDQIQVHTLFKDAADANSGALATFRKIKLLRKTFSNIQPDTVLSFLTKVNFFCACALAFKNTFFIVSERNNPLQQRSGKVWKKLIKFTFDKADRIVMQTDGAMTILDDDALKKAVVIPNPSLSESERKQGAVLSTDIVAVGRLTHQKGFDILVDAIGNVVKNLSDVHLTIWGEGEERKTLEDLIETKGLRKNISLPGNTTKPMEWINSAKLFVLSSRYEGFPNVLAEAMSSGMASISTDCPWGPSELIESGKNGLLVPVDSSKELAQAIEALLNNPSQQNMFGKSAVEKMEAFSRSKILEMWDSALDDPIVSE